MSAGHPSTLVYHAGALGDFITSLPAFSAWRRLHPSGQMALLGRPEFAPLAPRGIFDEVWDAGAAQFARLFGEVGETAPGSAGLRSALLFCLASSPLAGRLARSGETAVVRQDPFPPAGSRLHIVDYHLALFPMLPFTQAETIPRVQPDAQAFKEAASVLPEGVSPVILHPGSGSRSKNWPRERFLALRNWLSARSETVAWVIGPAEEGFPLPAGDPVLRGLSLPGLAAALSRARILVGNDSGVAHLAAAVGTCCVVLFGASDPAVWAPRGTRVHVVGSGGAGIDAVGLESVRAECEMILEV